jgi:protein TonB
MSSYTGTADRPDRAKAIAAVIAVHAALAFGILTGLDVKIVGQAVEQLKTFDFRERPPPPPPPPEPPFQPQPRPKQARLEEGAAGRKANPSPIVAPKPRLPVPSPIPAAPIAGTGSGTTAGAANSGTGTGAGGSGIGRGGGGDYSGFTPARRVSRIPDREYRRLAATGIASGSVGVTIKVNTDGGVSNCRVARTSGDSSVDALMCQLTLRYVRFSPARDASGRPVAQDVTFFPNWWKP